MTSTRCSFARLTFRKASAIRPVRASASDRTATMKMPQVIRAMMAAEGESIGT